VVEAVGRWLVNLHQGLEMLLDLGLVHGGGVRANVWTHHHALFQLLVVSQMREVWTVNMNLQMRGWWERRW